MDQAKTSLDVARTAFEGMKAEHPAANATFVHAPIERLPLADASIDAVLLFNVLEEMPDLRAAFREVLPPATASAAFLQVCVPAGGAPAVLALLRQHTVRADSGKCRNHSTLPPTLALLPVTPSADTSPALPQSARSIVPAFPRYVCFRSRTRHARSGALHKQQVNGATQIGTSTSPTGL